MGFKERQQRHKEEFKAEILETAVALFAEEGYAKFSMRKLAARIKHSPTTIYLYFRDKDDLLLQICENLYASLLHEMQELRALPLPPEQMLKATFLSYIRYNLANPEQYKVVFFSNPNLYAAGGLFHARHHVEPLLAKHVRNYRCLLEERLFSSSGPRHTGDCALERHARPGLQSDFYQGFSYARSRCHGGNAA